MNANVVVDRQRRRQIWPMTVMRAERLEIGVPLAVVAFEAGISSWDMSRAERGLLRLSGEQERRRVVAIARLRLREKAATP